MVRLVPADDTTVAKTADQAASIQNGENDRPIRVRRRKNGICPLVVIQRLFPGFQPVDMTVVGTVKHILFFQGQVLQKTVLGIRRIVSDQPVFLHHGRPLFILRDLIVTEPDLGRRIQQQPQQQRNHVI